jgi:hypothetical protein
MILQDTYKQWDVVRYLDRGSFGIISLARAHEEKIEMCIKKMEV